MLLPQLFLTFATKITWGSQTFVQLLTLTSVLLFTSYKVSTSDTPQPTERGVYSVKYCYHGFKSKELGSVRCGRLCPRSHIESPKAKGSPHPEGPREHSCPHPAALPPPGPPTGVPKGLRRRSAPPTLSQK